MYSVKYLPMSLADILSVEKYLYELEPDISYKFIEELDEKVLMLCKHPFMYQPYEENNYFRSMPLPYGYRLFYHNKEYEPYMDIIYKGLLRRANFIEKNIR